MTTVLKMMPTVLLEDVAAIEVAFEIEMIVDRSAALAEWRQLAA